MSLSVDQLQQLSYQLEQKQTNWDSINRLTDLKESFWARNIRPILGNNQPRILKMTHVVNQAFVDLEQKGIKIFDPSINNWHYQLKAQKYYERFTIYLKVAEQIRQMVGGIKNLSPELKEEFHALECHMIGLKYSLGAREGGVDKLEAPDQLIFEKLKVRILQKKLGQPLNVDKELNRLEIEQLEEAACYPEWVQILLKNSAYEDFFYKTIIRDYNPVSVFIMCPDTQKQIKKALLTGIIGRIRRPGEEESLAFQIASTKTANISKRILTLPVYHSDDFSTFDKQKQERVNILKPTHLVTFRNGNYRLTIKEILTELSKKNEREVKVNLCAFGLINRHPVHGKWDAERQRFVLPPMTLVNWTDYVPPGEIVNQDELEKRYSDSIKDKEIFFKVVATREQRDLYIIGTHGFLQTYIHMGDRKWKVLDMGVFMTRFQQGGLDGLSLICNTVKRVLCLMDQNGSYSQRQKAALPLFTTHKAAREILNSMYHIMEDEDIFQLGGQNCSHPIQTTIENVVPNTPNYYKLPIYRARFNFLPLDAYFSLLGNLPIRVCNFFIFILINCLGAFRSYSLTDKNKKKHSFSLNKFHSSQKEYEFHHPANLHLHIEKAHKTKEGPFVNGEITFGNTSGKL
ncbi:MAG: hypothetical protein H0W88_10705 [Parachlamydiaceae bacterium]|nr:hypothetical protein [Parachlamydiaceae bacterium]